MNIKSKTEISSDALKDLAAAETIEITSQGHGDFPPLTTNVDEFLKHLEDACPSITSDPEEAGDILARYIIGEEVGSGSIGQVIEAFDEHLGRRIAIKVLHGGPGVSKERLSRFLAEAQITAQLEHPTIVPVYEIGKMPGGMPYFAMKLVKGELLDDVINQMRIGDRDYLDRYYGKRMIRTFFRLCQGIAYAHARGVVHRDLKPANIMIGEFGVVQIMDWGLAKVMGDSELQGMIPVSTVRSAPDLGTLDGSIAGTPAYMSPEQAHGDVESVAPASDVYTLGLLLAEMLSLVRVYRDNKPSSTLDQVREARPVDPQALNPKCKIDPELVAIVKKCTQPVPADRYQDAAELCEDIRKYLEDREIDAHQDITHRKVVKWSRRNPMLAGAIYAASVMLGALGMYLAWQLLF